MSSPETAMEENGFKVIETFHGGGMGLVHRARHLAWNIEVAVKHPRRDFLSNPEQVASFHSECATWAEIGLHPYVATCFYSREIDGLPCVVAEYLPGGSVQDAIERREIYEGEEDACLAGMLTIATSTAWGLERAHKAGLIHCDVKPGNMLLTGHGTAKIADFGLAVAQVTSDGSVRQNWMTKAFAAPEQILLKTLTPSVDVWGWAASMLSMFVGGVSWESGTACGAVRAEFMDGGGKSYRISPMPASFAAILEDCFRFDPNSRISNFEEIAARVSQCYEEIFQEPSPASKPDLDLISADSLNNRAVSFYDLGKIAEVHSLLDKSLTVDPLHPESNFNSALLGYFASRKVSQPFLDHLEQVTEFDLGEYRPWLYRACLLHMAGRDEKASVCIKKARKIAAPQEAPEVERIWDLSVQRKMNLILAPPISGEDLAHDSARFRRLIDKAELAISDWRLDDASRFLLMSGDIPGFARHPKRRRLLMQLES